MQDMFVPQPPPPEAEPDIEEIRAFAGIAGFTLKATGQGWTDGTGVIHGCEWTLRHDESKRSSVFEGYPTMGQVKAIINEIREQEERKKKRRARK